MNKQKKQKLISDIIEKSNYIHKNTKRGKANYVRIGKEFIEMVAEKNGMTFDEAVQHVDAYLKGEIGEF